MPEALTMSPNIAMTEPIHADRRQTGGRRSCTAGTSDYMAPAALVWLLLWVVQGVKAQESWQNWCQTWPQLHSTQALDVLTHTAAVCPACRSSRDYCEVLDSYSSDRRVCSLPGGDMSSGSSALCGPAQVAPLLTEDGKSVGHVTVFQTPNMELIITYQVSCPYVMRPIKTYSQSNVPFMTSLDVQYSVDTEGSEHGHLQYLDTYTGASLNRDAPFTCASIKLQLGAMCEPDMSSALAIHSYVVRPHGCACSGNFTTCPVVDLTSPVGLVLQFTPRVYAVAVDNMCVDTSPAPLLLTTPASVAMTWKVQQCTAAVQPPSGSAAPVTLYRPNRENDAAGDGGAASGDAPAHLADTETGAVPEHPAPPGASDGAGNHEPMLAGEGHSIGGAFHVGAESTPGKQAPAGDSIGSQGMASEQDAANGATGMLPPASQHAIIIGSACGAAAALVALALLVCHWRRKHRQFSISLETAASGAEGAAVSAGLVMDAGAEKKCSAHEEFGQHGLLHSRTGSGSDVTFSRHSDTSSSGERSGLASVDSAALHQQSGPQHV